MKARTHALLLWAAATDSTFEPREVDGEPALVGDCIHCGRDVCVPLGRGGPLRGTLEHIHPRHHEGTDAVENLAVACPRCNAGKGVRLDHRPWTDPTLRRVVEALAARRRARFRCPPEGLALPPVPPTTTRRRRPR